MVPEGTRANAEETDKKSTTSPQVSIASYASMERFKNHDLKSHTKMHSFMQTSDSLSIPSRTIRIQRGFVDEVNKMPKGLAFSTIRRRREIDTKEKWRSKRSHFLVMKPR